jgi:4'-phosphopantetheinyl transferase
MNTAVPVQVYQIDLKASPDLERARMDYLDSDERVRADRFRFSHHRQQFILSHAALRILLARELSVQPGQIHYLHKNQGKPELAGGLAASKLHFSLAHAHQVASVAICQGCEIGIDLEYLKAKRDIGKIAARFFSDPEADQFRALHPAQQTEAFYLCWTRKEAFVKALGTGFSGFPFRNFDVTLTPGEPARLLRVGSDFEEHQYWTIVSFQPAPDYVGAVALREPAVTIQHHKFVWPTV